MLEEYSLLRKPKVKHQTKRRAEYVSESGWYTIRSVRDKPGLENWPRGTIRLGLAKNDTRKSYYMYVKPNDSDGSNSSKLSELGNRQDWPTKQIWITHENGGRRILAVKNESNLEVLKRTSHHRPHKRRLKKMEQQTITAYCKKSDSQKVWKETSDLAIEDEVEDDDVAEELDQEAALTIS